MIMRLLLAVALFAFPVSYPDQEVSAPVSADGPESTFGEGVYPLMDSVLITGRIALGPTFGVVQHADTESGIIESGDVVSTTGPLTGGHNNVVVGLDSDSAGPILRVWRWNGQTLEPVTTARPPAGMQIESLLTAGLIVVASSKGAVMTFQLGADGLILQDTLETGLSRLNLAIDSAGTTLAVSGVPQLAGAGDVVIYRRGDATWSETQRLDRIGGGPAFLSDETLIVQRNSFFTKTAGSWTVLDKSRAGEPFERVGELPGVGAAVTVLNDLVYLGDPETETVLTFLRTPKDRWPFQFVQAIRSPGATGDAERFGAALGVVSDQVVIGSPGALVDGIDEEGLVRWFSSVDGPIGCSVVGTAGPDILEGTQRPDTICGLGGDDTLIGNNGSDLLDGGEGEDTADGGEGRDRCENVEQAVNC